MATHVYDGAPPGVTVSHYGASSKGRLGSEIIAASTGGTSGDGPLINDDLNPAKEYRWYLTSFPSSGVVNATELGEFTLTGASDGIYTSTYRLVEDGLLSSTVGVITTSIGTDLTPPSLTGTISVTSVTSTTYTATCPVATDAAGISKYQYRLNAGAWVDIPPVSRIANIVGRTPGSTDTIDMRAMDTSGNFSSILTATVNLGAADSTPPVFAGTLTISGLSSTGYTITYPAATDANSPISYEYSLNAGASYTAAGTGLSFSVSGRTPSTTDNILVRAKDPAGNASATITTSISLPAAPDTTAPVFTGTLTVTNLTDTSYDVSYSAATDANSPITYLYSFNNIGYTSVGSALTVNVTGRAPGTTDTFYVIARDPASNSSTPLTASITLLNASPVAPSPPSGLRTVNKTSTSYRIEFNASPSAVLYYEYSLNGGAWISIGTALAVDISGRTPGAVDTFNLRAINGSGPSTAVSKTITLATGIIPPTKSAARTLVVPLDTPVTEQEVPKTWTKDAADILDYTVDWTGWNADCGDTTVDGDVRVVEVGSGITIVGQGFDDSTVSVMLSGGIKGRWTLIFGNTTSSDRFDERTIYLEIK